MNADTPNENPATPEAPDMAFDRLRASDPAAADEPDTAQIRDLIRERMGATRVEHAPGSASRWLKVAAASAAVLAVGFGGYLIGADRVGGQNVATTETPASVAVESNAPALEVPAVVPGIAQAPPPGGSMGPAGGAVVKEGNAAPPIGLNAGQAPGATADNSAGGQMSADAAKSSYLGWSRTVFIDGGVTGEAGTAESWALDPAQVVSAETAARLAAALGITGEPRREYGAWVVGSSDGTGPSLQLAGDGAASVYYGNPAVDPYYCPQPPVSASTASDDAISIDPMPTECPLRDVGPAPQGDAGIAKVKEVLTLLGLDPSGFDYEAGAVDAANPGYGWVTAFQVLNDQRTGVSWQVSFSGSELSSVYGSLAPIVSTGDYPIISAAEAVQRLSDPRFGGGGATYPIDYVYPTGDPYVEPTEVTVPPLPAAGGQIAWPVTEVTITSAQLGVAMLYQPDGSVLLLPAYALSDATGVSYSVIAVADSAMNFAG